MKKTANHDPAVDTYIAKSADFAIPILTHLRQLVHTTCPGVVEAIKWGIPHFDYKGEMLCILAAYKAHCSFTFWKADLMKDDRLKKEPGSKKPAAYLGKITSLANLPNDKELVGYIKEAMVLNEKGIKLVLPKSDKPKVLDTPDYFAASLAKNKKAKEVFDSKSPSFRKNYIIWITDAKTDETRQKRIDQSLEWIAEGKGRFWQSEK